MGLGISGIKIFKVNEYDWVAARNLEEAIDFAKKHTEMDVDFEPYELTDQQMISHFFYGEDGCEEGYPIPFVDELVKDIKNGVEFPCLFASTEW